MLESLQSTGLRPASDYLQPDELQARFKKVKKKVTRYMLHTTDYKFIDGAVDAEPLHKHYIIH